MATQIQFRRDTAANWTSANPVLAAGELGLITDTMAYKIGNGATAWNSLSTYQLSPTIAALVMGNVSDPSAPAAGYMNLWAKSVCGKSIPQFQGSNSMSQSCQPALFENQVFWVYPTTGAAAGVIGGSITSVGTLSTITPAAGTFGISTNFLSGAVSGNTAGTGEALAAHCSASGAAAGGGWFFACRLIFPDANYGTTSTGARFFVGMTDQTLATAVGADNPAGNRFGFANSTNLSESNWMLSTKDNTTENRVSTGIPFVVNHLYDFYVYYPLAAGGVGYWRVDDLTAPLSAEGNTSSNLPLTTAYMRGGFQLATLTTVGRNVRMKRLFVDSEC